MAILLLMAGAAGLRSGPARGPSGALGEAVARAATVPLAFADWEGRESGTDLGQYRAMGVDGGLARHYRHRRSGRSVSILLVFGAPGPISVHTPEHCMVAAGFRPDGPTRRAEVARRGGTPARLLRRLFAPSGPDDARSREVYWSWGADRRWDAPENPRLAYADRPYLCKIYASRFAAGGDDPPARAELEGLVAEVLDALDRPPG